MPSLLRTSFSIRCALLNFHTAHQMRSSLRACFSTRCSLPTLHTASLLPGPPSPLVSVQFSPDSTPELYPSSWLWANAPAHHDPGTNQRTLSALALSCPPALESLSLSPTALTLHWGGGLRTTYPAPYLHSQRLSSASLAEALQAARPAPLPSSKAEVPAFAHASLVGGGGSLCPGRAARPQCQRHCPGAWLPHWAGWGSDSPGLCPGASDAHHLWGEL